MGEGEKRERERERERGREMEDGGDRGGEGTLKSNLNGL